MDHVLAEWGMIYQPFVDVCCFPTSNVLPLDVIWLNEKQLQSSKSPLTDDYGLGYGYEYNFSQQ